MCQPQQHAAPLEWQPLLGGEAGREMLMGRHGEGEAANETHGWRCPPGRRHSIQNRHASEETAAVGDPHWGTDTSEGQWPWAAHATAVLA